MKSPLPPFAEGGLGGFHASLRPPGHGRLGEAEGNILPGNTNPVFDDVAPEAR